MKTQKVQAVYRIAVKKLTLKKVGYINLQTGEKFKTKRAYLLSLVRAKINKEMKRAKAIAQALVQVAILEATKERAARRLQQAKELYFESGERFIVWVATLKASKKLAAYKKSLPLFIKSILF